MPAKLEIRWWDGTVVGHLVNRGSNFFAYEPTWLELGRNLSPLKLPFTAAVFNAGKEEDGLPGLLADCLPIGRWGEFAKRAGVPKDLVAEARAWHRRIRESV